MAVMLPLPERETRERLAVRHLPLARRLARRYARSPEMLEELEQVAALGLVKAAKRYDPSLGNAFSSFAVPTILGELKRHFRDTRWAMRVPRDLQERAQRVFRASDRLTAELRRSPTVTEVAERLGLKTEEVLEARDAFAGLEPQSLDAPLNRGLGGEPGEPAAEAIGSIDPAYALAEERTTLRPALHELDERERLTLRLRFVEDLTQQEIADRLGLSQMQVSRILSRSLAELRERAAA